VAGISLFSNSTQVSWHFFEVLVWSIWSFELDLAIAVKISREWKQWRLRGNCRLVIKVQGHMYI